MPAPATFEPQPDGAGEIPNPELHKAFLNFVRNELKNPPKTRELFKIPEGVSPDWQDFFNKVAAYHERQCAGDRHRLIRLEKRSWVMEDDGLSEFEMLVSATDSKEKGNGEFRSGEFQEALMHYINALFLFETPDVLNNVAACALKMNQFDVAEDFSTRALDMDLLSSPPGLAKAYFRRATARLHLGNFEAALEDANAAHIQSPDDSSINDLRELIHENTRNNKTQEDMANYLETQPKPHPKMKFEHTLKWANDVEYAKLPDYVIKDMKTKIRPPTF